MKIVTLAARNIVRHWRRTLVTTLAMGFAGFIMILFAALMEGMIQVSERNAVSMDLGDIQIHDRDYRDDPDLYKRITSPGDLVKRIRKAGYYASERLYGFGLAAAGTASAGVQLRGLDIKDEQTVTKIHLHVAKGDWLSEADPKGVVVGRKLARTLAVKPGDELVFLGQASDGSMANDLYKVRGVLKSIAEDIDRSGLFMPQQTFRNLMVLPEGSHEIAIMRPDRSSDLELARKQIATLSPKYEALTWRELRPVIARILNIADTQIIIMIVITYIAVGMVVLNAVLMGVFERIHEFGIMKAIGVTPWQLTSLIYVESLIQVIIASVMAAALGWWASSYYQVNGIDLSSFASATSFGGIAMDPIWYAYVTPDSLITPILFLFLMTFVAVIYPAVKAAVIQPVRAIYYR